MRGALTVMVVMALAAPARAAGPPPARMKAPAGSVRMAQGSFCWTHHGKGGCADYLDPDDRTGLPRLRIHPGELVRFRLRFVPSEVALMLPHRTVPLEAVRRPRWRVTGRPRWMMLFARREGWGDTSYVVRTRGR
jgi:hypothetical protein